MKTCSSSRSYVASNRINQLVLAFTYQDHNFHEMREFVTLASELGADKAIFERIQKTDAMTEDEYAERAVHRFTHPLHQAFLEIVRDPIFRGEGVATDFEYQLLDEDMQADFDNQLP